MSLEYVLVEYMTRGANSTLTSIGGVAEGMLSNVLSMHFPVLGARSYEIAGDRLTVKSTDPNEHWKVIGQRY